MSDLTPPAPPYQPVGAGPYATQPYAPQPYTAGGTASYGQVPGQPLYWSTKPPTNSVAIVALILGFVVPLGGVIAGHIALAQIKRTGEGGRGMALAGVIIGYAYIGFLVLYVAVMMVVFSSYARPSSYYY